MVDLPDELIKSLKEGTAADLLLSLNTIIVFGYFFLYVRFGQKFLEFDLATRLIFSFVISITILYYLTCIEVYVLKRKVEGIVHYFNEVFLLLLFVIVIVYVFSRFTYPILFGHALTNEIMYPLIYLALIIIPLKSSKIFGPSPY